MTANDVEELLRAGEVWRLARTRPTALARAVREDPRPLLEALEAAGFCSEAASVEDALAGRITERDEEVERVLGFFQQKLANVMFHEPAWVMVALYEKHPELRGAVDLAAELCLQHRASLDSWRAGHAMYGVLQHREAWIKDQLPT